ncbi:MAG: ABC transporter substrate-binding protein [Actinomycetota bacterium]
MFSRLLMVVAALALLAGACSDADADLVVGAVYPTSGGQGMGGRDELRGVRLAAELVNARGGVRGRGIVIRLRPASAAEAASQAVDALARAGVPVILGSHGSTISARAAAAATRKRLLFWETGAVGNLGDDAAGGGYVFRFAPTGASLGRAAVSFVHQRLQPLLPRQGTLRYAVAYVDDAYGRSVGGGAVDQLRDAGLTLAGTFPYRLEGADYGQLARRIGDVRPDVLVVAAYLEDGVALRRAILLAGVPLVASIGTSSSYCMPEFGAALGDQAVGLFASDKPDGEVIDPGRLAPEGAWALRWASGEYRRRHREPMRAEALSGFAGGWALFRHVLPRARDLSPESVARAALRLRLPMGSLPNGAGLELAPQGASDAGANRRAAQVIWEWVAPLDRAVVWPPSWATAPIAPIDIEP